jgi:hypothetical protein
VDDHGLRPVRRWRILRLVLVASWLVAAATAGWTAPRHAGYAQAQADVLDGRVVAYQWGERWDDSSPARWFGRPTLVPGEKLGPLFVWRLPDGRVRWADTNDFDQVTVTGTVDEKEYAGTGAVGLAQAVKAAGPADPYGDIAPARWVVEGISIVLGLTFLVVLVSGPAPVLGTRWYWFWLVVLPPYALGLLFWLFRDRPWSRRATGGGQRPDRGFLGLLTGLLVAFLLGGLRLLLGG